ncbi:MAG TPA: tetratricopeptide repeat protein [Blastocatellia bacterium]|nr:tetratricopeptide repeat protein [Blastocatellia bacterium]
MFQPAQTLVIMLAALAITASAQQTGQQGKTWAVVVGISKYQKLPGGQQLQFGDRDAALFAEAVQKRGVGTYNVRLLTGADATVAAIKSAVGTWLARSVSTSDTVIFFFSGHGLFEKEFGESYLLGFDSDTKDPFGTALALSELRQALASRIRAGHVLIIADAMRRDFFDPETDPGSAKSFAQAFDQLTAARHGVSAILASGPGEFSREGQRWAGHGVFAKHLADVLTEGADRNADGTLTADEVFEALAARVSADTSNKQHVWRSGAALDQVALARVERQSQTASVGATAHPEASDQRKLPPVSENRPTTQVAARPTARDPAPQPDSGPKPAAGEPAGSSSRGANANRESPRVQIGQNAPAQSPTNPANQRTVQSTQTGRDNRTAPVPAPEHDTVAALPGRISADNPPPKPSESAKVGAPSSVEPPASKPSTTRSAKPPGTEAVSATQPSPSPPRESARAEVKVPEISPAPKPAVSFPTAVVVSAERADSQPETLASSVPASRPEPAPTPLVLQLEAAITLKRLIEPKNSSAWDFYQRLASEPGASSDVARLKPMLAAALGAEGRAIVSGDVRADNISDKVDDFKRAGQMLARARSLAPDNGDVVSLEKLSAAEALISLQFYDEAARALAQLQSAKLAAVENAMGLVYQGQLDSWRAERAFKRAIELDSKWAAPHYNLALLYRSQQNLASLEELEAAAALDPNNVYLVAALGEEYFTRQQFKQATEAYRRAVSLKPSDDTLHTKLGHALYSQGLQDEANREYQKAKDLRGKQP